MWRFLKIVFRGILVLTAATVVMAAPNLDRWANNSGRTTLAALGGDRDVVPGWPAAPSTEEIFLAQKTESAPEKPASPAPPPKKAKARRAMEAPSRQMERSNSKSIGTNDELERSGTKKLGGQVIRANEPPGGE